LSHAIGILGGTFDPIHLGHLRPAVEVRQALALDHVRLMPARVSPLRDAPETPGGHRLAMVQAALADSGAPDLLADGRELDRPGPSYTADTLAELADELRAARFHLIVGADAFASFDRWQRWPQILERAHVVVTHRPGMPLVVPDAVRARVTHDATDLAQRGAGCVLVQPVSQLDISATAIREAAAAGRDLRYWVPESVRRYIGEHHLYQRSEMSPDADRSAG
jgi:nicotinate-nucleotide adenylyltransferase